MGKPGEGVKTPAGATPPAKAKEEKEEKVEAKVEHKSIYEALAAFQRELKPIERTAQVKFKTKSGQEVDFTYSPLGDIMAVILPILGKHGLAVRHELSEKGVECILTHETATEEQVKTGVEMTYNKESGSSDGVEHFSTITTNELRSGIISITKSNDMKEYGSAMTYARRYSLTMLLGIASEEDKDVAVESQKRVESQALKSVRTAIETATAKDIGEKYAFLKKEIVLAERAERGEKDAKGRPILPSLGFKKEQIEEMLSLVEAKAGELDVDLNPPKVKEEERELVNEEVPTFNEDEVDVVDTDDKNELPL